MNEMLFTVSTWAIPVLLAVTLHEAAHGYMACLKGDDTARLLGRVTLNPLRHVDPFGTIILPGLLMLSHAPFLLGWAKPVPVRFDRLRDPIRDMIWVALAGPGTNLALAIASALLLHGVYIAPESTQEWLGSNLINSLLINLVLAVFNMIPVLPLDGGRVLAGLLPRALAIPYARTERFGMLILIGLVFLLPWVGDMIGMDLNILGVVIGEPVRFLYGTILSLTGHDFGSAV